MNAAGGDDARSVGAECGTVRLAPMLRWGGQALARHRIPDVRGSVEARSDDAFTIGAEGGTPYAILMSECDAERGAAGGVPDECFATARGDDVFAVGAESGIPQWRIMLE